MKNTDPEIRNPTTEPQFHKHWFAPIEILGLSGSSQRQINTFRGPLQKPFSLLSFGFRLHRK